MPTVVGKMTRGAVFAHIIELNALGTNAPTAKTLSSDRLALDTDVAVYTVAAESGTADDIDGISGFNAGQFVILRADTGDTLTLKDENAGAAAAADRIRLPGGADVSFTDDEAVFLYHDDTLDRWVLISGPIASSLLSSGVGTQGSPGIDGEQGEPGPPGIGTQGPTGATGVDGVTILIPGEQGEQGEQGSPGLPGTRHVYRYLNVPDAAPTEVVVAGNAQGIYHLSGPVDEIAYKLHVLAKTAPGANGLPVTWQYNDSDDLDSESWTTIATYTLSSEKSNSTASMTNAVIPANRLMRANWGAIVGSPADAQTILLTRPVA